MRRSLTASSRMPASAVWAWATDDADSFNAATNVWTSVRRISAMRRRPHCGSTWIRQVDSSRADQLAVWWLNMENGEPAVAALVRKEEPAPSDLEDPTPQSVFVEGRLR